MGDFLLRVVIFGAMWLGGAVGGVAFTFGSAYTSGLQVLEMIFGDSVAAQLTDAQYCGGTGFVVGAVSGIALALGLAALFAGREEGAEEDDSTFRLDSIASAVSGFCLVVGPLTGFLLGHLLIGAVASLIGLGVGLGGGAVWAVVRSRAA